MRANRGLALVMLMAMSWGTVATAEETGYDFAGRGESSDPVERLVQQLVEGVCGDDDACRGALVPGVSGSSQGSLGAYEPCL